MKILSSCFLLVLGCLLGFTGCSDKKNTAADDSDVNGYSCVKCKTKFYTDREVFAEFCPSCKDMNLKPVVVFVCEKDQEAITTPRVDSIACPKCGASVNAMRIAREADLKAWGAVKKLKSEVASN